MASPSQNVTTPDGDVTLRPDARSSKPNDRSSKPNDRLWKSADRSSKPDDRLSKSADRSSKPDDRSWRSDNRSLRPDVRSSRPDARSWRSDVRSTKPDVRFPKPTDNRSSKPNDNRSSRPGDPPVDRHVKMIPKSRIVGYYSIDGDRKFLNNASRLLYYNPPDSMKAYCDINRGVHLDLNEGADLAVRRKASFMDEGIDLLLQWIKTNNSKIRAPAESGKWIRPKFVSSRGTLGRLLTRRVTSNEDWILCAAKWKGTIYLCTDKKSKKGELEDKQQIRFGSWGHKFEQYILSKSPDKLPDTTKPVIETEEFRCVYERNIGGHSVMFCSVIKGVESEKPLREPLPFDKLNFIELKTNRIIEHSGQEKTFQRYKLVKWWAACFLTNTEYVLCGFRDESGVVNVLNLYHIDKIIKQGERYWKPGYCVNDCKSFLTKIEETVVRDCTESIYKFEKKSNGEIDIKELPASSEYTFLPSSFLEASG